MRPSFPSSLRRRFLAAVSILAAAACGAFTTPANAAPFTPGNLVVYRIGTGAAALTSASNEVFLDEYTPAGTLVQSIALPTAASGDQNPLTANGTSTSEGFLTRSADGRYLVLPGYGVAPGTASVSGTSTASVPRVYARVDGSGNVDTSTSTTSFSGGNPRGAASADGSGIWATGSNTGLVYLPFGGSGAGTVVSSSVTNTRAAGVFDGQLYLSSGSGTNTFRGVNAVGTGLPTGAGETTTRLPGLNDTDCPSSYGFFLADLTPSVAGVDTLYIADDGNGALTKWSLVSGTWTKNNTIGVNTDDYRGLAGKVEGTTVTLYAILAGSTIVSLVDDAGYNANMTGTPATVATAATNTAIRGIAFAPESEIELLLTEIQSNQSAGSPAGAEDYWELTNIGSTAKDISGHTWHDSGRSYAAAAAWALPASTTIAPGESVIFTEMDPAAFRAWWGLPPTVQVFQSVGAPGLGQNDGISFFDDAGNELFFFSYAAAGFTREDGSPSIGGHAGPSAGGSEASQALIWVPGSGTASPRYTAADGTPANHGSFSAVAPATDFGSPGTQGVVVPTVDLSDNSAPEGNVGTTPLALTVTRSDTSTAFTVDYAVSGGTATAGDDFVLASGTLDFTAGGPASLDIVINVNGDTTAEPDETVVVTLSNLVSTVGGTVIRTAEGTATILNDDAVAPSLTLNVGGSTIATGGVTTLRVAGSGLPEPTYQWYQGAKGDTSNPVGGATSPTLLTGPLATTTEFWVRASNAGGDFDSDTIVVNVVAPASSVDLSNYVRVGRYDLPEPTRTALPPGTPAHNLLGQEASGVAYNWDTDTLFIVGDGGRSVTQVSKTGVLIDTMTLALGGSPQGTEFYDIEGIAYLGGGEFVMAEERDRQVVKFTYAAGATLTRGDVQTVKLGTFVDNTGTEDITFDPVTGGFIAIKEISPLGIFQTGIDFAAGTATNGSAATVNSTDLFDPALAGMTDFAGVFALANLPGFVGQPQESHLLLLGQEDGRLVAIDRSGAIGSTLQTVLSPGDSLSVAELQHEGVTMDPAGFIYLVNENGGGSADYTQLWVYAPATAPNAAPTDLTLNNEVSEIMENTPTFSRIRLGYLAAADDGLGINQFAVGGPDAAFFEIDGDTFYLKAGTVLDFETKTSYSVTLSVDDTSVGATPDATYAYTLTVLDQDPEVAPLPALLITEVAPWSSGNSPVGEDWFEVTNVSESPVDISGWRMDDSSKNFANAVALNGITTIAPGETVVFVESDDPATTTAAFLANWFGDSPPGGLQIGTYTGSGVGLGTSGDAVWLFNDLGQVHSGVTFGAASSGPVYATFDNTAGLNDTAVTQLSAVGVNGAALAAGNPLEVGSPGYAAPGLLRITEVAPWSSGNSPLGEDWFEVTNVGARVIDISGWKMDDGSESPVAAVPLSGVPSIAPGESVIFIETNDLATKAAEFLALWFGGSPPPALQIGAYSGSGVGLSTGGDAVNLFDTTGTRRANVSFGTSPVAAPFGTFDNAALDDNAAITLLSAAGVNGAFVAANSSVEIGSPGAINRAPVPALTIQDQEASANGVFSYMLPAGAFADPENGPLSYSATLADGGSLPPWLSFNPTTVSFSGTPSAVDLGRVVVRVTASDDGVPPRTGSIDIVVNIVPENGSRFFPQSVASGDPREASVVLWTRLMDGDTAVDRSVSLHLSTSGSLAEVGTTEPLGGANLWTGGNLTAQSAHDGVVKVKATGLDPETTYYYQFTYNGERSPIGRTKTAPAPTSTRAVKYAAINCNDFVGRYFNVLKHLADQEAETIDFVLNLGDYIYETTGDPSFQTTSPGRAMILSNPSEAIDLGGGNYAAQSVGNYRDIYKTIRQDRQLQRVHELFPMISIWDDHEFSDDNWKDNATYFDGRVDEQQTARKRNGEQVWMEFLPTERGLAGTNTGLEIDGSDLYPNTTIYDSFNFGENLDLILTDIRTERADHLIPEDAFPATVPMDEATLSAILGAPTWAAVRSGFAPYVNIDDAPYAAVKAGLLAIVGAGVDANLATLPAGQTAATSGASYAAAKVMGNLDASFINSTFAAAGQPQPFDATALDAMPRGLSFFLLGKTSFFSDFGSRYQVVDQTFQLYAGYMYQLFQGSGGALGRDQALFSPTQESFLAAELGSSSAAGRSWRVVASSTPYTPIKLELGDLPPGLTLPTQGTISGVTVPASIPSQFLAEFLLNADEPAGFPQYRQGIIDLLAQHDAILVSGDIHAQLIGSNVATNSQKVVDFTVPSAASSQFRRAVSSAFASVEALMTPSVRAATGLPGDFAFDSVQKQAVIDATDEIIKRNTAEMVDADTSTHGYTVFTASPTHFDASFRKIDVANVDSNLYSQSVPVLDSFFQREEFRVEKTGSGPATDLTLEEPTPVTISVAGNVGGTVSGGGSYLVGSDATFSAIPGPGFVFAGWKVNGVPAGTASPLVQPVTPGLVVEASFNYPLQLLHFADAEAGLLAPQTAPNLAALVDAFDDTYANTIILAGGDNYIPGPFAAAGTDGSVAATHTRGNNPFAADIEIHNRIGVQASTVGNHEFDFGTNAFSDAINDATFPYLSANLDFSGDSGISSRYQETVGVGGLEEASSLAKKIVPSAVITVNGEKIGLVGATTQIIETISSTGGVEVKGFAGDGSESNDMTLLAGQLQPVIDDLTAQGVNKIVLMAHLQQIALEQALAPLLTGVDIVLAAGSNTRLGDGDDVAVAFTGHAADFAGSYPIVTAGADAKPVLIVNTDNEFTYLGRLIVDFDPNGEIVTSALPDRVPENGAYAATAANVAAAWGVAEADLGTTAFADGTKGAGVKQITDAVQAVISAKDGDVKGFTNFYLEGERNFVRNQETNLGNLSADANAYVAAEAAGETIPIVSLKNGGGIRAAIGSVEVGSGSKNPPLANPGAGKPAGAVSLLDIENSMRFNNLLMAFETTPAGLKAILEHGVAVLGGQGRFPQIGGVAFSYDPSLAAGSRIRNVVLIDEDGATTHSVIESGSVSASAPSAIRLVSLNFLANGGDGYPMKANGEDFRYLLTDGTLSAPLDEGLSFTAAGNVPGNALGEQAAMGIYLAENFGTPALAYNEPETAPADDLRIQNLSVRADTVSDVTVTPSFTGGGSVSGGGTFALGTTAQFTATANGGSFFAGWIVNGAPAGNANPLQVTVTVGMTVEATFLPNFTLQLLHLSDGEAGLLASQTAPNLAALVEAFEDDYDNTLILSGGDNFIPGAFLNAGTDPALSAIAAIGRTNFARPDIAIHNLIGVEASAIGNHEWDLGSNVFMDAIRPDAAWIGAQFPHISSNLDYSGDGPANGRFTDVPLDGTATDVPEASSLNSRLVPVAVVTKGGEKIGLVGATTQILRAISSPSGTFAKGFPVGTTGVDDMDLLATHLQPYIDELAAEGIDKIVLLSHLQQIANEQLLATKLRGVDIVLAAGSNSRLGDADDVPVAFPGHAATFAGNYPIATAGADGKPVVIVNTDNEYTYLGRLVVDFDGNGELVLGDLTAREPINGAYAATAANVAAAWGVAEGDLGTTAFAPGTKGGGVQEVVDAVQGVIDAKDGDVKGYTSVYLEGERNFVRSEETNLGSLTADANAFAYRAAAAGDGVPVVSLKNGGGIRAQIGSIAVGSGAKLPPAANPGVGKAEGGISQLDIENSMRFNNRLMVFDTTPQGLKNILEHAVANGTLQGRFPQVGGVAFAWDPARAAGDRIVSIALVAENGGLQESIYRDGFSPWAPATIRFVTLNFLAGNSDSPDGLGAGGDGYPMRANGNNFRYLLADGSLSAPVDPTLNFTSAPALPANPLGEQQAFADFLGQRHATTASAYALAETPAAQDRRIQNLSLRGDEVPFDLTLLFGGDGTGAVGGRTLLPGERQGYRFTLGGTRLLSLSATGSTELSGELLDAAGQVVGRFDGPGDFLVAGIFPAGDYLLRVINDGVGNANVDVAADASVKPASRPDAAVGRNLASLRGVGAFGPPARQQSVLVSRRLASVRGVATVANLGELPDALSVRASRGNGFFRAAYTSGGGNATAALVAGTFETPEITAGDGSTVFGVRISPNRRRLSQWVGQRFLARLSRWVGGRLLVRPSAFPVQFTASSTASARLSDSARILVRTR